jgi:hypothetical protein
VPGRELTACAEGSGYYANLKPEHRAEQPEMLARQVDAMFPRLPAQRMPATDSSVEDARQWPVWGICIDPVISCSCYKGELGRGCELAAGERLDSRKCP